MGQCRATCKCGAPCDRWAGNARKEHECAACWPTDPPPRWGLVAGLLHPLVALLHHTDEEVLADACWSLSYLCEPPERIDFLIATGALPRLTALLGHTSPNVQAPALRCIGNVATGNAEQTQAVLACDALGAFGRLIDAGKKDLKKEACWIISNIAAGSAAQIDAVIDELREERRPEQLPALLGRHLEVLTDARFLPRIEARRAGAAKSYEAFQLEELGELVISFLEEVTQQMSDLEPWRIAVWAPLLFPPHHLFPGARVRQSSHLQP